MWSDDDDYFSYSPYYFGSNDDMDDDSDDHYFEDGYDDYYYSSGEDYSSFVLARSRARTKSNESESLSEINSTPSYNVSSLQDLCCRFVARRFPFAFVEHRSPPIPDELQLKIIQYSFPEDEKLIQKYAEFSRSNVDYCAAKRMLENGNVKDMNQIGFRLSASVDDRRSSIRSSDNGKYYVTVHFDRGKITSAHCSCELSTNWCSHVVATCLARIKDKNAVTVHMPVSDSLNSLDREQLLKFAQYLLCEHQNERIVETAQQLLGKLLSRQQRDQQEDINMIAGAPDPTAGPGLDEEAHWFVSKTGFKSRCENLMYETQTDLGFVMYNDKDNDRGSSVAELWDKNCLQRALVRDEMDLQLDKEYCSYSSSRHHNVLQVLETIGDLLQDDFMSAVSALTMCTEQLIEKLTKVCRGDSPYDRYRTVHRVKHAPKEVITLCGSLAGGFTPRVSSCRTLSDELSRLWRLTVLSPGIPTKQRQGVIDQLRTLNQTVSVPFVTGTLRPWQGLEVAIRLSSINWNADEFQKVLKGKWVQFPVVSSCMAIQLTCQSKNQYVSDWMTMEEGKRNEDAAQSGSTVSVSFHNPHCISFGAHFYTDIHSVSSMIEALNTTGYKVGAMRLAVALSGALVAFYKSIFFGYCDVNSLPVSARCFLGTVHKIELKPEEKGESPMEVETSHEKANNGLAWPEDTILSITTFSFLYQLLSQKADLADSCLVEMRSQLGSTEAVPDHLRSVQSLKFHVGVLGLFLQRLPAPSLHHEVEQYNYECWLTYQLICSSPSDTDLSFLTHLGQQVQSMTTPRVTPPSSLCRVIFHHLFKGAPAALSKCLTERQSQGLGAAFHVLGHVNEYTVKQCSSSWMLFEYANCRLWAKLAEVVLRSLSDSHELLEKAMGCIHQPKGMLGAQSLQDLPPESTPVSVLSRLRDVEFVGAKCRVAYCLAKSLSEKQGNSLKMIQYKMENGDRGARSESFEMEMPRKIMKSGVETALKLCAVQIAAHSLWLQKLSDRSRVHLDTVRWVTDFVVSSGMETVKCLVKCKGNVTSFLSQSELLDLCEKVLRKENHIVKSHGQDIVQGILLSLLQKASQSQASEDMKRIVSFCREKRCATKVDLLPWICKGLESLAYSNGFLPFEVLMDASHGMLEHYKEKLATSENLNRVLWAHKGALHLDRLFNEGVHVEDDSDNEDGDGSFVNRNPYKTPEPHPFLQTAFDLGMMGLEQLKEKPDLLDGGYRHYRRCPVKEHLSEFCRLVGYLVNKKWLVDAKGSVKQVKSPKKAEETPPPVNAKPGCSHWIDVKSQPDSRTSVDSCYLHKFVCSLIDGVSNPLWLFEVLQELGEHLCTEVLRSSPTSRQERQNLQIKEACQGYPSVKLLLQRNLDEFSKLLLGPEMSTVIDEVVRRRDRRRLEQSEFTYELSHCQLINTRLKDVLKTAKRAFSISDSSGSLFKNLSDEITSQHSILQSLLDRVLKEKEVCSSDERELAVFPHPRMLPALFAAQGLFSGLFEREYIDDYSF